jgi:hypothetical protein
MDSLASTRGASRSGSGQLRPVICSSPEFPEVPRAIPVECLIKRFTKALRVKHAPIAVVKKFVTAGAK